ncbi:OadG family protein [Sansalvadorimonas sp. 2012CJ34-2]|uniref:Probable oxaloacetate decarboxylase gamma chain n=1 Tax=Parendozoicomonas callyspongiae TaxID=2942213 RepID=A0ABT0PKR8_9GAMM|nr:OadG family transporter subunit [Sansalvadorimonas sp. 2012CJ34-2]MCL6271866.1 OadG family protein [Sansalvadorimonas sp. 2012CJ34-2]
MSQAELMNEGLSLMLYGMGFVFTFLTVLVFATSLMSKSVLAIAPEEPAPAPKRSAVPVAGTNDPASDPVLLAVIGEAVRQHRERRR